MCRPDLPASFASPRGRAKLEYVVSATTIAKRSRHSSSNTFLLLPSAAVRTFQTNQHNFNVDIDNGGATSPLTANIRNIITVCLFGPKLPNSVGVLPGKLIAGIDAKHYDHLPRRPVYTPGCHPYCRLKTLPSCSEKLIHDRGRCTRHPMYNHGRFNDEQDVKHTGSS